MSQLPRTFFTSFSSLGRHWYRRMVPDHIERTKNSNFEFTVASYNVLADQLMEDNSYLYFTGRRKDPNAFDWNYRKHNLLKEIRHANADILCLQEVQEEHYYDWFSPQLREHGYDGTFKKRSGDRPDGCATFFKLDKFCVETSYKIDYYRENVPLMDRNNVAILLFLNIRSNELKKKSTLCISNTHLLFNQRRGDIKLAQLAHLLADIEYHSRVDGYDLNRLTTILCGDFNSHPYSPLYKLITTGELRYEGLSRVQVSGQLQDSRDNNKLGKTLFPSSIGLSHNCQWADSEHIFGSNNDERTVENNRGNYGNFRDDFMSTFSVETGMYEVLHIDSGTRSTKPKQARHSKDSSSMFDQQAEIDMAASNGRELNWKQLKMKRDNNIRNELTANIDNRAKPGYLRHGFSLSSSYSHYQHDGTPEVTTSHDKDASTVDYIFYSSAPQGTGKDHLYLNGVLGLYNAHELEIMNKLPNRYFSSDHSLLQASFLLHQS